MLKWTGKAQGIVGLPGIPARDLSADEVERYGGIDALLATGLYEKVATTKGGKIRSGSIPIIGEPSHELISNKNEVDSDDA